MRRPGGNALRRSEKTPISNKGCAAALRHTLCAFTGAVIGYFTDDLSHFLEKDREGRTKTVLSDHVVIPNRNSRSPEIVNDYLYAEDKHSNVVPVNSRVELKAQDKRILFADHCFHEQIQR